MTHKQRSLSRRQWLNLSAGALLGFGLWPGRLRAVDNGRGGSFRFLVLNDTHFHTPQCPAWFDRVRTQIRSHQPAPELCLVVGDLAENGKKEELGPMRDVLKSLSMPFYVVMGNHDYSADGQCSVWNHLFPRHLNYHFEHRGWCLVGLDSTEGTKWKETRIQPPTLQWLDDTLPKLDRKQPTILFTHFPLGPQTPMRPINADDLLARFKELNLVAVFNGHHHGFTERNIGDAIITTNRCCAISRNNHDKTPEKGYFICTAENGNVRREFVKCVP